jgi:hypothetical protein
MKKNMVIGLLAVLCIFSIYAENMERFKVDLNNLTAEEAGFILTNNPIVFKMELAPLRFHQGGGYLTRSEIEAFLKTAEGRPYVTKLAEWPNRMKNEGIISYPSPWGCQLHEYDINEGGFWIVYRRMSKGSEYYPTISGFYYEKLPGYPLANSSAPEWRRFLLKMSKDDATNIIGNNNVGIKFRMKLDGTIELQQLAPIATSFQIILYDKQSGKQYGEWSF